MDLKGLAFAHFEKSFISLAALACLSPLLFPDDRDRDQDLVLQQMQDVDRVFLSSATLHSPPVERDPSGELERRLAPQAEVEPMPGWVVHRRPGFLYTRKGPPPEVERRAAHQPPTKLHVVPGRGVIDLSWTASRPRYAAVLGYRVERRTDQGGWSEVAAVGDVRAWRDPAVNWRHTYAYRVSSVAAVDTQCEAFDRGDRIDLPILERWQTSASTPAARPLRDLYLIPTGTGRLGQRAALAFNRGKVFDVNAHPTRGRADIEVFKWIPDLGRFVRGRFKGVKERARIGGLARDRKTRAQVDLSTGVRLRAVRRVRRDMERGGVRYQVVLWEIEVEYPDGQRETIDHRSRPAEIKKLR